MLASAAKSAFQGSAAQPLSSTPLALALSAQPLCTLCTSCMELTASPSPSWEQTCSGRPAGSPATGSSLRRSAAANSSATAASRCSSPATCSSVSGSGSGGDVLLHQLELFHVHAERQPQEPRGHSVPIDALLFTADFRPVLVPLALRLRADALRQLGHALHPVRDPQGARQNQLVPLVRQPACARKRSAGSSRPPSRGSAWACHRS